MRPTDVAKRLSEHPLLVDLPPTTRARLLELGVVQTFEPGAWLLREGAAPSHYWFLLGGTVKVSYTSPDGFEVTVKVFAAPGSWGEMELLTGHPHVENCVAVDKATTLKLSSKAFVELLDAEPRFMKAVLYDTCARFFIAAQNERALAFLSVAERLANLLLAYLRIYGVPVEGGTGIRIRLSQSDLAADLGVAKKSITRTLGEWREAGIIEQRGTTLVVTNVAALEEQSARDVIGVDWIAGRRVHEGRGPKRRA